MRRLVAALAFASFGSCASMVVPIYPDAADHTDAPAPLDRTDVPIETDAVASFPCGRHQCVLGTEFCVESVPGLPGPTDYSCRAVPDVCAGAPTCACVTPSLYCGGGAGCRCMAAGAAITVTVLNP